MTPEQEAIFWQQLEALYRPLNPSRIKSREGMSYLEAWDVIAHLTRLFGPFNWDKEVRDVELLFDTPVTWTTRNGTEKSGWDVGYRATVRLTVWTPASRKISEDVAVGFATHQPTHGEAHDLALKTAASDALKRAAKDLGNQFGLSLYDKGSTGSAVAFSIAHPNLLREVSSGDATGESE